MNSLLKSMVLVSLFAISVGCTKKEGGGEGAPAGDASAPVEGAAAPTGESKEAESKPENVATDAPAAEGTTEEKK